MKKILLLLGLLATTTTWAATGTFHQADTVSNSIGGPALIVPGAGTTFLSDSNFATVTSKVFSGDTYSGGGSFSGTFTGTPTFSGAVVLSGGPIISGAGTISTAVHVVDSADSTKQLAFSLSGMTASRVLTLTSAQTTTQSLSIPDVGSGDSLATLNATQTFGAGSTWHGVAVDAAHGGTGLTSLTAHDVLVGNGTGTVTLISPSTSGFVLTSNGTSADPTFQAASSAAPTINNTAASPQSVTAAGGISLSAPTYKNVVFVKASTSGTHPITATPSVTACTAAGQELEIISEDATNLITLQSNADLAGSQLLLNGPWTSGMNNTNPYTLHLVCDGAGTPAWVELGRNN